MLRWYNVQSCAVSARTRSTRQSRRLRAKTTRLRKFQLLRRMQWQILRHLALFGPICWKSLPARRSCRKCCLRVLFLRLDTRQLHRISTLPPSRLILFRKAPTSLRITRYQAHPKISPLRLDRSPFLPPHYLSHRTLTFYSSTSTETQTCWLHFATAFHLKLP